MKPPAIINDLCATLDGVVLNSSWGETARFYNPGRTLPSGVYFSTIKERDGENARASLLTRDGVFRVSIGVSTAAAENRPLIEEAYWLAVAKFGARQRQSARSAMI
jgi:hypothetical protein